MTTAPAAAHAVWSFAEHEHQDLTRGINRIHDVACQMGRRSVLERAGDVRTVLRWLDGTLAPHVGWEESWLYPEIDRRLGTPWATRAARFDHQQIRVMTGRLEIDRDRLTRRESGDALVETCGHLFGLEALLRAHVEREERFLIPLLEND